MVEIVSGNASLSDIYHYYWFWNEMRKGFMKNFQFSSATIFT